MNSFDLTVLVQMRQVLDQSQIRTENLNNIINKLDTIILNCINKIEVKDTKTDG